MREVEDVIVIGAGIAGLTVARTIVQKRGCSVLLLEKSRGPGGRLSTKRFSNHRIDHGTTAINGSSREFQKLLNEACDAGVLNLHHHDKIPYYRGNRGMSSLPKYLAKDLQVLCGKRVVTLVKEGTVSLLTTECGSSYRARCIVSTCPIPQLHSILSVHEKENNNALEKLPKVIYRPCIAALLIHRPSIDLPWSSLQEIQERQDFHVFDCSIHTPETNDIALCIQLNESLSRQFFTASDEHVFEYLFQQCQWLDPSNVQARMIHRWKYAFPLRISDTVSLKLDEQLYIAGDCFVEASAEGAYLSGLHAAGEILKDLDG